MNDTSSFSTNCSLLMYDVETFQKESVSVESIFPSDSTKTFWFNLYGFHFLSDLKSLLKLNRWDDFLIRLFLDGDHRNKVIELEDAIFLSLKTIHFTNKHISTEQMMFSVSSGMVLSVQERKGDYFEHIRERLRENKGVVRKKKGEYLLYLIIEAIIDNYADTYEELSTDLDPFKNFKNINPTPDFVMEIEKNKQDLFLLKKAISTLRDAISKLEKARLLGTEANYFSELKEQANYMLDNIDFDLHQLESTINLVFNMQSHRLNEVMKTLTIFSVVFIPLTFLAGLYGMNFKYMPELDYQYSYPILMGIMVIITIISVVIFKNKKWF